MYRAAGWGQHRRLLACLVMWRRRDLRMDVVRREEALLTPFEAVNATSTRAAGLTLPTGRCCPGSTHPAGHDLGKRRGEGHRGGERGGAQGGAAAHGAGDDQLLHDAACHHEAALVDGAHLVGPVYQLLRCPACRV